jgi:hypothetical protein
MRSPRRNLFDLASELGGPPQGGPVEAWFYGVMIAGPLFVYGLICVITRHAWFLSLRLKGLPPQESGIFHEYDGNHAIAIGALYVGIASFAHFQWFWSNHPTLYRYYEIGKLASLAILVSSIGWWIFETIW